MLIHLTLSLSLLGLCTAYAPPCVWGTYNSPPGCDPNRIKPCSQISTSGAIVIWQNGDHMCSNSFPKLRDTVQGWGENTYVVQFDGGDGECLAIRMEGGECWGQHPNSGGSYDCMGRCGGGCGSWACSNWGRDCLKHDVCSWYFTSRYLYVDDHCGDEAYHAQNDWAQWCLWWSTGDCEGTSNSCWMVNMNAAASPSDSVASEEETSSIHSNDSSILMIAVMVCIGVIAISVLVVLMMKKQKERKEESKAVEAIHVSDVSVAEEPVSTEQVAASHVHAVEVSMSTVSNSETTNEVKEETD